MYFKLDNLLPEKPTEFDELSSVEIFNYSVESSSIMIFSLKNNKGLK